MSVCSKCKKYGLRFKRNYKPVEFIEGRKNSRVWIVGLNPAAAQDWVDSRTTEDLEKHFDDLNMIHGYFKDFKSVSKFMLRFLPPPSDHTAAQTSYWSNINDVSVCVVLSGFIGRIDNFAKRRLGVEIEARLRETQAPQT